MKRIFLIPICLLSIVGCSCNKESFSIEKFKTYNSNDISTYKMEYIEENNDIVEKKFEVYSNCDSTACEYYVKKEENNLVFEYTYKYLNNHYLIYTKTNGVLTKTNELREGIKVSDKNFEVSIHTLKEFIKNDIALYDKGDDNFETKISKNKYLTTYKAYTIDNVLSEKTINQYSFDKENISSLERKKEIYSQENNEILNTKKIYINIKYNNVVIPE